MQQPELIDWDQAIARHNIARAGRDALSTHKLAHGAEESVSNVMVALANNNHTHGTPHDGEYFVSAIEGGQRGKSWNADAPTITLH